MRATMHFEGTPASVPRARQFVADHLERYGTGVTDTVTLLASELATNAVVHARTSFAVELTRTDGTVRVAVSDGCDDVPLLLSATTSDEHGRGMQLLTALSTNWGIEDRDPGKTVWFEVVSDTEVPA